MVGTFSLQSFLRDWQLVRKTLDQLRATARIRTTLSPVLQQLLISGEDHRHGWHPGFDPFAMLRALWRRTTRGTHEGASTIDQQLVRVLTGRYERKLERKVREILLAVLLKNSIPARELPALYLLVGYYGWRMNGLNQACRRLHIDPRCCTPVQAAELVARLKYPEPRLTTARRIQQIRARAAHLLRLREHHLEDGTYAYLVASNPVIAAGRRRPQGSISSAPAVP